MPFQKGESGNPGGYSSARRALNNTFIRRLRDDFEKYGDKVISKLRREDPATYFRVIASFQPKEVLTDIGENLADLLRARNGEAASQPVVTLGDGAQAVDTEPDDVRH